MNLSNLNEIKNLNKYYSQYYDLDQRLFSKKCVNRNNGKFNEYFKIVDELLSKDLFLKTTYSFLRYKIITYRKFKSKI